ncbi:oxygen-dependent choline dehydrogenase [Cladorrhinum sp. PSN259]|nr:oxygen-dependent choline dehydrogenase [Cladorrhinum sp. PSN259]
MLSPTILSLYLTTICLCLATSTWATASGVLTDLGQLKDSYDYIIAGGGLSGLVVANRLSANPKTTVLVVEYGDLQDSTNLSVPFFANWLQDASLMLNVPSVPQSYLGDRTFGLLVGAAVGGGTVVNGMAITRGERQDYDAWEELGNKGWGWKEMLRYFRKSSTLNPASSEVLAQTGYKYSVDAYGNGPFQATWPSFQYPDLDPMNNALTKDIGIPFRTDGATNGEILGVYWKPISADGKNVSRCSARKAYYDPVSNRPNLHLLVKSYVAKITTEKSRATGVQVIGNSNSTVVATVKANKEVILAAGAINTPKILQISGIGPRKLLESFNITVVQDLPGVGANYQDHATIKPGFKFNNPSPVNLDAMSAPNSPLFAAAWDEYVANRTGPLTQSHGNTRAVFALQNLTSSSSSSQESADLIISSFLLDYNHTASLPSFYSSHPTLLAGYEAQMDIVARRNVGLGSAVLEVTYAGDARIGMALQKPLSRGTVHISSLNPHPAWLSASGSGSDRPPALDPNTISHPFDREVARLGFKMGRRFMASASMARLGVEETNPGLDVARTDEEIDRALREGLVSSFNSHPCGTAAMSPESKGGVVDERLRVHGVKGLRLVDASVLPVIPAGHLQTTMYAVAEKAADLILDHGSGQ